MTQGYFIMQLETIALDAAPASSIVSIPTTPALAQKPAQAQPEQVGTTETYSDNILGPVGFTLSNLRIAAKNKKPAYAVQTPYIIGSEEQFSVSVDIEFNKTPLSVLLMCLKTRLVIDFAFEGYGKNAVETDVKATGFTQKGEFKYTLTYTTNAVSAKLTAGLYSIAAIATIGPVENECSACVFGHGYLDRLLVEVYPSNEECGI
jgi:hypothetical protein